MKNIKIVSLIAASLLFSACSQKEAPVVVVKPVQQVKVVKPVIVKSVNVTGAAGELKRLTFGGYEELVSELSSNGEWLLIDTYSKGSNKIIQKLNVLNGQKMILTPANSSNSRAVWSKNDKKIIFTTNRSGSTIAESMGVNGESGIKFITNSSLGKADSANINSAKDDIVFVLNGSISLIKPNGTQIRMFGTGRSPKFSPNGKRILFIRDDGNYFHIFVMNKNGNSLMQLTSETYNDYEAVWSPDGKRIAFLSDRSNNHIHLYVMDINGRNLTQLTDGNYNVSSLDWGDDGYIYFSANAGGNRDIWRLKPKTK
jgi:TolB protein